jgi:hypothetical protein
MTMDVEHWELLGTSRWVQRGEPRGLNEFLPELDNRWDRAVAEEPVKGRGTLIRALRDSGGIPERNGVMRKFQELGFQGFLGLGF